MRAQRLYREVRRAFEDFVVPEFRAARGVSGIEIRDIDAADATGCNRQHERL